jgi:sortase (surface protein transpeptidase)
MTYVLPKELQVGDIIVVTDEGKTWTERIESITDQQKPSVLVWTDKRMLLIREDEKVSIRKPV